MSAGTGTAADLATNDPRSFGESLRLRRRAVDLTQDELARHVGCARSTIKRIEADDLRPSKQLAQALAEQLNVPATEWEAFIRFARSGAGPVLMPPLPLTPPGMPATTPAPHNLPHPVTSLIGREHEIGILRQLLSEDGHPTRLLTLAGPGGVGKTSLAIEVAASMRDHFADGIFFVNLAPLTDATLVTSTIAHALGMHMPDSRPIQTLLQEFLDERQILLLLDNFEHVIPAAPLISELLAACPHLQILVTSRESLRLRGESLFYVPPLTLPEPKRLAAGRPVSNCAAVDLFVRHARQIKPDLVLTDENEVDVAEICVRLDGLPLALELAAACVRILSVHDLRLRLEHGLPMLKGGRRDAPARHQSLHAVLAWSYDLLDNDEKALFEQASIFVGGWSLEAAEAVCRIPPQEVTQPNSNLPDVLLHLVEKSLITAEERNGITRYHMLRTVSEYAHSRLIQSEGIDSLRTRYLDYFIRFAQAAEFELDGAKQLGWLGRLDVEYDNLRMALTLGAEHGDHARELHLAAALSRFWEIRGYFSEGRTYLARAVASTPLSEARLAPLRAKALLGAGTVARLQTDFATARSAVEESLSIWRSLGDVQGLASGLLELGTLEWFQGDYPDAVVDLERARAEFVALGDQVGLGKTLAVLGRVHERQGDYHTARALLEESLAFARQREHKRAVASTLGYLGAVCWYIGENRAARSRLQESLELARELGDKEIIVEVSLYLGDVCRTQGDYGMARTLHQEALSLAHEIGNKQRIGYAIFNLGLDAHHLGDNALARVLAERSLQLFEKLGDRRGAARAFETLGMASCADGDLEAGRMQHEACLALARELGDKGSIGHSLINLAQVAYQQDDFEQAILLLTDSLDHFDGWQNKGLMLPALVILAGVAFGCGHPERAARLCGKTDSLLDESAIALEPMVHALYQRTQLALRQRLGETVFVAASAEGRTLTFERASGGALQQLGLT